MLRFWAHFMCWQSLTTRPTHTHTYKHMKTQLVLLANYCPLRPPYTLLRHQNTKQKSVNLQFDNISNNLFLGKLFVSFQQWNLSQRVCVCVCLSVTRHAFLPFGQLGPQHSQAITNNNQLCIQTTHTDSSCMHFQYTVFVCMLSHVLGMGGSFFTPCA